MSCLLTRSFLQILLTCPITLSTFLLLANCFHRNDRYVISVFSSR